MWHFRCVWRLWQQYVIAVIGEIFIVMSFALRLCTSRKSCTNTKTASKCQNRAEGLYQPGGKGGLLSIINSYWQFIKLRLLCTTCIKYLYIIFPSLSFASSLCALLKRSCLSCYLSTTLCVSLFGNFFAAFGIYARRLV